MTNIRTRVRARGPGIVRSLREAVDPARLLLVAKTALAVGLAWLIAPHTPGVTDEYPYYAPLGALVTMYPTLMGSVRSGLQTLLGLATGIGLAAVVVLTVGPTWWSIPAVVGVGVLVSGTGWFGVGREYVPMAALFVLIVGGQNADEYSLGYLVQMGVGVVVGLIVNLVIAPAPLTRRRGEGRRLPRAAERASARHRLGRLGVLAAGARAVGQRCVIARRHHVRAAHRAD